MSPLQEQRLRREPEASKSFGGDTRSLPDRADGLHPVLAVAVVVDLRDLPPHNAGHALERALNDLPAGAEVVLRVNAEFWCTRLPDALKHAGTIRLEADAASVVSSWRDAIAEHVRRW